MGLPTNIPFQKLVAFLRDHDDLLLLRPHDFTPEGVTGDIDLLGAVSSLEVEETFGEPSIMVSRNYVIQRFFKWGLLDVLPQLEWDGVEYLNKEEVFAEAVRGEDGILRPRLGHDAVISWLTSLLWGGFFKEKYRPIIERALKEDRELVIASLQSTFGKKLSQKMVGFADAGECERSTEMVKILRRAIRENGSLSRQLRHWYREAEFHLTPPMPFVAFLGPDGSGKSTVIAAVEERLAARRISTHSLHWRPGVIMKGGEPEGGIVTDPHGELPRGLITSVLKLGLLLLDWHLGYWGAMRHKQAKSKLTLSDRFYRDLLVDPIRYRYGGPRWLAKLVFALCPQPNLVFVLYADPEVIYARKQEVTKNELERQIGAYRALGKKGEGGDVQLVNVDRPVEEIAEEICGHLEDWWAARKPRLP